MGTTRSFTVGVLRHFYLWIIQLALGLVAVYNEYRPADWPRVTIPTEWILPLFLLGVLFAAFLAYRDLFKATDARITAVRDEAEGHHVTTTRGRKALRDYITERHEYGVHELMNKCPVDGSGEFIDWVHAHSRWVAEIVTTMRERGCDKQTITTVDPLGAPRHIHQNGYRSPFPVDGRWFVRDHEIDMLAERLGRLKEVEKQLA